MTENGTMTITRRTTLLATPALLLAGRSRAETTVQGVKTNADVAKAEAEGAVTFYTHDSDPAGAAIADAFTKDFPKIKASYLRAQNGALYSKLLAERSAGRYGVDVIQFSEVSTALDFKKRDGYTRYESPEVSAYPAEALSDPSWFLWTPRGNL